jgi:hypothetical protein
MALICLVGKANNSNGLPRWQQVHFNQDVARQFFSLQPGDDRTITLEKLSAAGCVVERVDKKLVFSPRNKNPKIEFRFGPRDMEYPPYPERPLLVVVDAAYLTYRYRTLVPGDAGYVEIGQLLTAGPSLGRGLHRRIVTLDEVESYWPSSALRGGV